LVIVRVIERSKGVLEVKRCPHGRGVFSKRKFGVGELIQTAERLTITTTPKSPPRKRWALIIGKTPEGKRLFWDEEDEGSVNYWSNFLDHSRQANVRLLIDASKRTARLIATRSIDAGDELFLNYKEYDPDNWAPD